MTKVFFKATAVWMVTVVVPIANAGLREKVVAPFLGTSVALPLSGITLSLLIFLLSLAFVPWFGKLEKSGYFKIGLLWVALTLCFEFTLGHFVQGKSWSEVMRVFDVTKGDLFSLAIISSLVSPWLAAKLPGLEKPEQLTDNGLVKRAEANGQYGTLESGIPDDDTYG